MNALQLALAKRPAPSGAEHPEQRPDAAFDRQRDIVESYNREDCESALKLRDWLEHLRAEVIAQGHELPRPQPQTGEASEDGSTGSGVIRYTQESANFDEERGKTLDIQFSWTGDTATVSHPEIGTNSFAKSVRSTESCTE